MRVPVFIALLLGVDLLAGSTDRGRPTFTWGLPHFASKVDRGVIESAAYLRAHAVAGDTFALTPVEPTNQSDDQATRVAALAGVPAYLARAGIQVLNGDYRRVVVEQRLAELTEVQTTSDLETAYRTLRRAGVDFLVTLGDQGPRFDPTASRAAFRTAGATVYRITREEP